MFHSERITGPLHGVCIAAYTTELEGLFYGYAKLCLAETEDVWKANPLLKITTRAGHVGEADALLAVENKALQFVCELGEPANLGLWPMLLTRPKSQMRP